MSTHRNTRLRERLAALRVIPVLRFDSRRAAESAIDCLLEAGYGSIELTLTTPGAVELIAALRKKRDDAFLVGAGTVLDLAQAQRCIEAGADYVVSPCLVPGLAAFAGNAGRGALLGAFTPGEVHAAWREGADVVKIFPAATGGPSHLAALRAIYPEIPLCPTGGISLDNMLEYFQAGAALVGIGNNVIDRKALEAGEFERVVSHARRFIERAGARA
jgi:2-dehydro-3-deoxyphosphogluconate aldolase / (4S)-4-hydroxy-2-oxoglutarate aldolase